MALDPGAMHTRIIENLTAKTGHPLGYWLSVLDQVAGDKVTRLTHLKADHGIGHHTAIAILREKTGDIPWANPDDLEASLRRQVDGEYIALYDELHGYLTSIDGVTVVPCKTYTGFKAKRQFAVLKPSKADGLHIGIALPVDAEQCLSPAKGIGSERITAKAIAAVGIETLKGLLKQAEQRDRE